MNKYFTIISICFPLCLSSQTNDSFMLEKIDSLITDCQKSINLKDFERAQQCISTTTEFVTASLGHENPTYAKVCFLTGRLHYLKKDYESAEKFYQESRLILKKTIGKSNIEYAQSTMAIGVMYYVQFLFNISESYFSEAKIIYENTIGTNTIEYAKCLNNLGGGYKETNQFEKAEPLLKQGALIWEKVAPNSSNHIISLLSLGALYHEMGEINSAEEMYLKAWNISKIYFGKDHPHYADCLKYLGVFYGTIRNYKKSIEIIEEFKSCTEKLNGKDNINYGIALNNLAESHYQLNNMELFLTYEIEAAEVFAKVLGKSHMHYGMAISNLSKYYITQGDLDKSESMLLEQKSILLASIGSQHLEYAFCLERLAFVYQNKHEYVKSELLLLEAKKIHESINSPNNNKYSSLLSSLAELYMKTGNIELASNSLFEAIEINKKILVKASSHLSEKEMLSYISSLSFIINMYYSMATMKKDIAGACYDNALFYKGFLLFSASRFKRLISNDTINKGRFDLLKIYHRQLAAEYSKVIEDQKDLANLEEKTNALEKELIRDVSEYGNMVNQRNWRDIQSKLKTGECAIEFLSYPFTNSRYTDSVMISAILIKPQIIEPIFIQLFEEKQLDSLLSPKKENKEQNKSELLANLYSMRGASPINISNSIQNLTNVYSLVWKPLEKNLVGIDKIYFSPSGILNRINFAAIPINDSEILGDRYNLIQLGSTKQLLLSGTYKVTTNEAVLFGGLNYEIDTSIYMHLDTSVNKINETNNTLDIAYRSFSNNGESWSYLLGTKQEVEAVTKVLLRKKYVVNLYQGPNGTEENFKNIGKTVASPRVLHLATHGFFFPDLVKTSINNIVKNEENIFKISENPMIRAGLLLSGANQAWKTGKPWKVGLEDGILTAYEISQMNLSNTELVVLSACETGLGEINGNEGVYGLQRAFKIAGAKYLIMSLWQVPDKQTSMLMTTFYKKWLEAEGPDGVGKKMTIPDAFYAAQMELRNIGLDPYQWAGFILVQ